ncbi:MAG: energy-coupling factor transporter ATPase [Anaerolineae bacterium]|nr:energy-coupling factor transporter ATPase [Anaerolineae bacterium]
MAEIEHDLNTLIRVENLHHTYASTPPIEALRGIDLTIRAGEYVVIVGANGSGKSTLARHLNALLLPTRGDVWIDRYNTRDSSARRAIRAIVQMVFQHPDSQLVATMVEEDVAFGPENFGVPEAELPERVRVALETVGMWAHRQRAPHLLSAGQKQRVAIAGALAVRPRVLVLDEATSMLDPAGRAAVLTILRALHQRGTTIIAITHEMDEATHADRVLVMDAGRIVMDGTPRQVFARDDQLRACGLDVPPIVEVSRRLGLPVCLTSEELTAALRERVPHVIARKALSDSQSRIAPGQTASIAMTPSHEIIIQVENLSHAYLRGLPLESRALENVDFDVARGETMGLVGATGSGKSTLMQHLNGLLRPQDGRVRVASYDLSNPTTDVRAVRRLVGLVFQQPEDQLFAQFVGDDVAFAPRQFGLDADAVRERVRWAMQMVGLDFDAFKDRLTMTLSGGERRRVALAGVLAMRPHILVADEPTAGLDPRARAQTLDIFRRLRAEGTTLVIASHRMDDVAALCQRVTVLNDGHVLARGTTRDIFTRADVLRTSGLDVPPIARIAEALRAHGWHIPPDVLGADELVAALDVGANHRFAHADVKGV